MPGRRFGQLVWLLFFFSGACGLMYEVVWARTMTHVFGSTAVAVGTVIAAFMSGLALGSWLLGKLADRFRQPLRLYAYLEIGVGIAALGAHVALSHVTPAYIAVYEIFGRSSLALGLSRFLMVFLVVLVPTLLMGGTLPVLTRYIIQHPLRVGRGLSALYAINTIGAVAGTLVTGFYLIGAYGTHMSVYIAVCGNIVVGILAWILSVQTDAARSMQPAASDTTASAMMVDRRTYGMVVVGLIVSGFTSFAYEIYWTRSLVFLLGSSTYAVTTMFASFLTGIALGGYLVRFVLERMLDRVALFGWIQIGIGLLAASVLPALFRFGDPQAIRELLIESTDHVGMLVVLRFAIAFLVMLLPATLIGATFPLVGSIGVVDIARSGATIGRIYALNILGNVFGALLPGLVLLSWLGIQRGLLVMALLNACIGLVILFARPARLPMVRWLAPVLVLVTVLFLARPMIDFQFPSRDQAPTDRVLFYREGPSATTKVFLNPETRDKSISVDGISIGGTRGVDFKQQLLAHLPKLLLEDVSRELSVGLGSAILAGESARHQGVQQITCVEIEPSVVAGAAFFQHESHDVLHDGRVSVVVDDVLNHLRTTRNTYDVISADEKTLMDYASNGFSYSREYYALLSSRLAPGGMVIQWVPTGLPPRLYRMVLKTFTNSFPHVLLWYSPPAVQQGPTNTILIGSHTRIDLEGTGIRRRLEADRSAFAGLHRYGLTQATTVQAHFVADERALRRSVRESRENTLAHPRYEFFSLREYSVPLAQRLKMNHDMLMKIRDDAMADLMPEMASNPEDAARLREAHAAESRALLAYRMTLVGSSDSEIQAQLESAMAGAPRNESIGARAFLHYRLVATTLYNSGAVPQAASALKRALEVYKSNAQVQTEYAIVLFRLGRTTEAIDVLRVATDLAPQLVLARRVLADAYLKAGQRQKAVEQLRALIAVEPQDAAANGLLARLQP